MQPDENRYICVRDYSGPDSSKNIWKVLSRPIRGLDEALDWSFFMKEEEGEGRKFRVVGIVDEDASHPLETQVTKYAVVRIHSGPTANHVLWNVLRKPSKGRVEAFDAMEEAVILDKKKREHMVVAIFNESTNNAA